MTSVKTALETAIEALEFEGSIKEALKACKAALQEYEAPAQNCAFEDDAMYYAWRKWEAHQVPATEEGTRMMHERAQAFIAGWLASKSKGEKDE